MESLQRAYVPELEPGSEELAITRVIYKHLQAQNCLRPGERESVAYRLAELMVAAKDLYTDVLPHLLQGGEDDYDPQTEGEETPGRWGSLPHLLQGGEDDYDPQTEGEETPIFRELSGVRMALIHLRDLIADFDESFMEAMASQREIDAQNRAEEDEEEPLPTALEFDGEL